MKLPFLVALAILIPLGLFVAAREAASWRPKTIGAAKVPSRLALSPDGRWLLTESGSAGDQSALWNLDARRRVRTLPLGQFYFLSPNSQTLAVVTDDMMSQNNRSGGPLVYSPGARIYDLESGRLLHILRTSQHLAGNYTLDGAWSPDGREFLITTRRSFYRFSAATGQLVSRVTPPKAAPGEHTLGHAISPDARHVIAQDDVPRIYSLRTGLVTRRFGAPRASALGLEWSPDGRVIWEADGLRNTVWQAQTGKLIRQWQTTNVFDTRLHFTPDSKHLATATPRGLELRDVLTGKLVKTLSGPRIRPFELAPDSSFAVSVENGKLLRWRSK